MFLILALLGLLLIGADNAPPRLPHTYAAYDWRGGGAVCTLTGTKVMRITKWWMSSTGAPTAQQGHHILRVHTGVTTCPNQIPPPAALDSTAPAFPPEYNSAFPLNIDGTITEILVCAMISGDPAKAVQNVLCYDAQAPGAQPIKIRGNPTGWSIICEFGPNCTARSYVELTFE